VDLHAVEQRFERRVVDFDVTRALGGRGQDEGAAIEPLVELTHSVAVEEQNLQRVTATTEEQKERAAARVVADVFLGKARLLSLLLAACPRVGCLSNLFGRR